MAVWATRLALEGVAANGPSLHSFRHATDMSLLQSGVVPEVIALWLGHENPNTTHQYVEADLTMKRQTLESIAPPRAKADCFRPDVTATSKDIDF